MKNFFLITIATLVSLPGFAQGRIENVLVKNKQGETLEAAVPAAGRLLRPLGNTVFPYPADIERIYPAGTDLTDVAVFLSATVPVSFEAADWSGIHLSIEVPDKNCQNGLGSVFLKEIKPASLPFSLPIQKGLEWTADEIGWAGACLLYDKNKADQTCISFDFDPRYQKNSLVVGFNEEPGFLEFKISGEDFNKDGMLTGLVFDVEESADGVAWMPLVRYVDQVNDKSTQTALPIDGTEGATQINRFSLNTATRYVRWIYTSNVFNGVGGDNVLLSDVYVTKKGATSVSAADSETDGISLVLNQEDNRLCVISNRPVEQILVYNSLGHCVASVSKTDHVDVSHLPAAGYFVKTIISGGAVATQRFIKK
ncbi:MAG: T9SS type A sorting domain-containing protein [Bacteroidales bacterium]